MTKISLSLVGFALALSWTPVAFAEEATPAPVAATTTDDDGDKVVCKRQDDTGSRVRKTKVCKTKAEWNSDEKGAQETMRNIQQKGVQPGGDSLQPG